MKISYNWLKEYVDIKITPEKLAELLTMHSFEVESLTYLGKNLEKVVVGQVLEKKKHPDADRLSVLKVQVGKEDVLEIVCGAPNVEAGQKVAVALVGADLPCGLKIEKRKVRGVESCGMVCAEDELGLGKSHAGIMVLDKDLKIGTKLVKALGLDDTIFEVAVLPNRAHDCLSHLGVAREASALTKSKLKDQKSKINARVLRSSKALTVKIENKKLCRRYSAAILNNIAVKESPQWLKRRLESCGVRSINNIVDITNYVMLSLGQPMHAFDADKLNKKIIVRLAAKGEKVVALDDKTYELTENDLVIADENKPVAIAGVMGGAETAVDEKTKNIIFESANFQGSGVRKTSKNLKLQSESSYRFEREIDPELTMKAIEMAVKMVEEMAESDIEKEVVDIYPVKAKERKIRISEEIVERLTGIKIKRAQILGILKSLGFKAAGQGKNIDVIVPTFRPDVEKINDVIEEIGRIHGYEKIPEKTSFARMKTVEGDKALQLEKDLRKLSAGLGWCEVYNYSFVSEKDIIGAGLDKNGHYELANPLNEDFSYLRTTLLTGLLKNAANNLKFKSDFGLFELGKVYLKSTGNLPEERSFFAGIFTDRAKKNGMFFEIKGKVSALMDRIGVNNYVWREIANPEPYWHKGRSAEIVSGNKVIGKIGELHPKVLESFGIGERTLYFEAYEQPLLGFYGKGKIFRHINRFPAIELDLAVVFDESVKWADVENAVYGLKNDLIKKIEPFDIYRGDKIGAGKKSIAFRITYQAPDRTLKDEEVEKVQAEVIGKLQALGGEVRK